MSPLSPSVTLATRRSQLAIAQTELARTALKQAFPDLSVEFLELSTTGDQQQQWSLEKQGGSGLFIKELEKALLDGRADIAVHSAKDMPTALPEGLVIAGYLEREDPRDVLVKKAGCDNPNIIATGSPRRRALIQERFPNSKFIPMRGTVPTRLKKIAEGHENAEATIVAAAGLARLGITEHSGLTFEYLPTDTFIPAAGQGAIALECRTEDAAKWAPYLDPDTFCAVTTERAFLKGLGCGCHTAFGAYREQDTLMLFHESFGTHSFSMTGQDKTAIEAEVNTIINTL